MNNNNRRQVIELFDLGTLELIAPVKVFDIFLKGKCISIVYDKKVTSHRC